MHCPICREYGVDRNLNGADVVITVSKEDPISAHLAAFICRNNHVFFVRTVDMESGEGISDLPQLRAS
ncbi:MAG TPA: hypothetical protein VD837_04210 [Terriglobales bacterium]|nr:hypothetical protein [Terriglobales bacterium]